MRLLICEFITGGGLLNVEMPESLARQGELIQQQLLQDLTACQAVQHIDVLRDPRLPDISQDGCSSIPVNQDFMQTFVRSCEQVDAVLPIAPETDQALLAMTEKVQASGARLLNSGATAVAATSSKYHTLKKLAAAGIPTTPVSTIDQAARATPEHWVIKPDDGVSGEDCRVLEQLPDIMPDGMILQPFIEGTSASLTLLCANGDAALLAVNEQYVQLDAEGCVLRGVNVNGLQSHRQSLLPLARAIASVIPELWGFVGVDLMLMKDDPLVLEINPRLTTAYAGLHRSLGHNPAEWLLSLADNGELPDTTHLQSEPVEIMLT